MSSFLLNTFQSFGGGADAAASVAIVLHELRTTNGTDDITVSGFGTPSAARFILSSARAGVNPAAVLAASVGATDGTNEWVFSAASLDAAANSDTDRRAASTAVARYINPTLGTTTAEASFNSWITDGVRLDVIGSGAAHYMIVILYNSDWTADCGVLDLATQNNVATITTGFQMGGLYAALHAAAVNDTALGSPAILSTGFGSYDGSTIRQCAHSYRADDGSTTTTDGDVRTDGVTSLPLDRYAEITSVDATSIGITSRGGNLSTWDMGYLALKPPAGENCWAGVIDLPTATGSQNMTGTGAPTPFHGEMIPTMVDAVNTRKQDGQASAFGYSAFNSTEEYSLFFADQDAAADSNTMSEYANAALALDDHTHAAAFAGTFSAFISGGWTLSVTDADGTSRKAPCMMIGGAV